MDKWKYSNIYYIENIGKKSWVVQKMLHLILVKWIKKHSIQKKSYFKLKIVLTEKNTE